MWKRFSVQKVGIVISLLFLFSSELFAQTRERPIEVGTPGDPDCFVIG